MATTSGFDLVVEHGLELTQQADTVIVPGFDRGPLPDPLLGALSDVHDRGGRLASICTGAFALARAGVLVGRRATTHWAHAAQLAREHPDIHVDPAPIYIDEGDVVTSAGVTAGVDSCLHLIARDFGPAVAIERARQMVAPIHRSGTQAQYATATPIDNLTCDPAIAVAMSWAQRHLHDQLSLADLARHAHKAPRTFSRSFTEAIGASPMDWVNRQRLRLACQLLENSELSIDAIAARSGLGSSSNLRLAYNTTPTAYRAAFS